MTGSEPWGHDPSVKAMRGLFARMEAEQKKLLQRLGISPYDVRLRACREDARDLFERTFAGSAAGRRLDEKETAVLYIRCLIRAFTAHGFPIPSGAIGESDSVDGGSGRP